MYPSTYYPSGYPVYVCGESGFLPRKHRAQKLDTLYRMAVCRQGIFFDFLMR